MESEFSSKPIVIIIFGATGDLTHRKLIPAIFNLALDSLLPNIYKVVGVARRDLTKEVFSDGVLDALKKFSRRPVTDEMWSSFSSNLSYVNCNFGDKEAYQGLGKHLDELDIKACTNLRRVFYFATSPEFFEPIAANLSHSKLINENAAVVVEKPFGTDLESAKNLNRSLLNFMREDQIFRIDHYLGKETVQNIFVFRFANGIFEPIWNHKYIDHIEITVAESIGVEGRGGYFDNAGILRDIVQNHLFQLLCFVALEPPVAFDADSVRDEKVKVLRSIRRLTHEDVAEHVIRGRYQSGFVDGKEVTGYLGEEGIKPDSQTETFAAMELYIDNWRWAGVPFFIRSGKRLPKRTTDISVFFKKAPHRFFKDQNVGELNQNVLSFRIQPDEGISFRISAKPPGTQVRIQGVGMDFDYGTSFGGSTPEAYERLLLDAAKGDATLFTRNDEIEQAWEIVQPILDVWKLGKTPIHGYEAGSWGPKVAEELIFNRLKQSWRRL